MAEGLKKGAQLSAARPKTIFQLTFAKNAVFLVYAAGGYLTATKLRLTNRNYLLGIGWSKILFLFFSTQQKVCPPVGQPKR